jgi:hypothetical protein
VMRLYSHQRLNGRCQHHRLQEVDQLLGRSQKPINS